MNINSFVNFFRLIKSNWYSNHRYRGGASALLKCLLGTMRLYYGNFNFSKKTITHELDCVTFSVIPKLTALWVLFAEIALPVRKLKIIVGDSSGGFRPLYPDFPVKVIPILNFEHGEKLDLFLRKVCTSEYVLICDDDVFILDEIPWNWARREFDSNQNVIAVSIMPRPSLSDVLKDKIDIGMGSYCLIVRRKIWLHEKLSFKICIPSLSEPYSWYYDTGDYANIELNKRGYKISIAPPEIQAHLVAFFGISCWMIRIQREAGNIVKYLTSVPLLQEKALRAILVTRGFSRLIAEHYPFESNPNLVSTHLLDRAENICVDLLGEKRISDIYNQVNIQLAAINEKLSYISQIRK